MQNSQRPLHSPDAHNGQRWDGEEIWRLNASRFPVWVAGTWLLEQLLWPLKVCSVRKLESGASQKADLDTLIERWVTKCLHGEPFLSNLIIFFQTIDAVCAYFRSQRKLGSRYIHKTQVIINKNTSVSHTESTCLVSRCLLHQTLIHRTCWILMSFYMNFQTRNSLYLQFLSCISKWILDNNMLSFISNTEGSKITQNGLIKDLTTICYLILLPEIPLS